MPNKKILEKGYTLPEREEAARKARVLRKKIDERAEAQSINKVFLFSKEQKDVYKGIDHVTNLKEEEAEQLEEVAKKR